MKSIDELNVKIFADGADLKDIASVARKKYIAGFTTNPTLMRKAGVDDYCQFAREFIELCPERPISFEVFTDDLFEMEDQAREIASWGENVYVKIPVSNTRGVSTAELVGRLLRCNIKVNVTAIFTLEQIQAILPFAAYPTPCYLSIFAGRIADTGRDPLPLMRVALACMRDYPNVELIWASPREVLNIFQADEIGCHIITVTNDILRKLDCLGKDLSMFSQETVQMFYTDAHKVGYSIPILQRS